MEFLNLVFSRVYIKFQDISSVFNFAQWHAGYSFFWECGRGQRKRRRRLRFSHYRFSGFHVSHSRIIGFLFQVFFKAVVKFYLFFLYFCQTKKKLKNVIKLKHFQTISFFHRFHRFGCAKYNSAKPIIVWLHKI